MNLGEVDDGAESDDSSSSSEESEDSEASEEDAPLRRQARAPTRRTPTPNKKLVLIWKAKDLSYSA